MTGNNRHTQRGTTLKALRAAGIQITGEDSTKVHLVQIFIDLEGNVDTEFDVEVYDANNSLRTLKGLMPETVTAGLLRTLSVVVSEEVEDDQVLLDNRFIIHPDGTYTGKFAITNRH